jgi:hypothetical protein
MLTKKVINGNGQSLSINLDFVLSVGFVIMMAIGGWGLLKVTEIPECYATKAEVDAIKVELSQELKDLEANLGQRLEDLVNSGRRIEDLLHTHLETTVK